MIALFSSVWGARTLTADRWCADGARSLEDVAKRSDLTLQQRVNPSRPGGCRAGPFLCRRAACRVPSGEMERVRDGRSPPGLKKELLAAICGSWGMGCAMHRRRPQSPLTRNFFRQNGPVQVGLKHFAAMARRIPREEIAAAECLLRARLLGLVSRLGGPELAVEALAQTYAQVTGSYIRGAPDSGDIDFLVVLPPGSTQGLDCGVVLSQVRPCIAGEVCVWGGSWSSHCKALALLAHEPDAWKQAGWRP